ncbi:transcriptional regulator [Phaffia rhodozyma]|uniref:Transcriptional regulator n=1 Tax=Phaffia rhodozyma TaxID=264483 RepID=A0A0F7SVT5_PHARH|nr:transcriptional regulator [Phaffia rhodozyma]CED84695.1 transcriptional regulator [Phaffia rhodozyma]
MVYIRQEHAERSIPVLHRFIRENPLGQFTTSIENSEHAKLQTTHIPFVLNDSSSEKGILRAHIARANPQAKSIIHNLKQSGSDFLGDEVLIIFNSPVQSYVTPKFYVETKPSTGKVVPTWNYSTVQVYGRVRVYYQNDPTTSSFLQKQVSDLSELNEQASLRKRGKEDESTWKLTDAPERYVEILKRAIIGLEIQIDRIEGRFKMSQEDSDGDWQGVVDGFKSMNSEEGNKMAEMIESRGQARCVKGGL